MTPHFYGTRGFLCLRVASTAWMAADLGGQGRRGGPPPPPLVEGGLRTSDTTILINKVMPAPSWALAERELIAMNAEDGPDDAVEGISAVDAENWKLETGNWKEEKL